MTPEIRPLATSSGVHSLSSAQIFSVFDSILLPACRTYLGRVRRIHNGSQLPNHAVGLTKDIKFAIASHSNADIWPPASIGDAVGVRFTGFENINSPPSWNSGNTGQDTLLGLRAGGLRPWDTSLSGKCIGDDVVHAPLHRRL